mmetsp:Transcript_119733/g.344020  ORF Transcript_119733/g.344020 Transcript_119733/m.344020 type:complete len:230 (+) Transcript_119733:97-786(+)
MFTKHATTGLIILALGIEQSERQCCQAWMPHKVTSRSKGSHLYADRRPHLLQRREALFQSIHVLIGTSIILPRSSVAYFDYTDEVSELEEEQANEAIKTPASPPLEQPQKKASSKRLRLPFERDDPVSPVVTDQPVVDDSTTEAPVISEPVVVTPSVEKPTDQVEPSSETVPATSDIKCLTDCMRSCQQEVSTNDKIACLDNCPTRCLSGSTPSPPPIDSMQLVLEKEL